MLPDLSVMSIMTWSLSIMLVLVHKKPLDHILMLIRHYDVTLGHKGRHRTKIYTRPKKGKHVYTHVHRYM